MVRPAIVFLAGVAWGLLAVGAARAEDRPRVEVFGCKIGSGRTKVLVPRTAEDERIDDDLQCWAILDGLPRTGRLVLAGELRILAPRGRVRTVATALFERSDDRPGRAWIDKLTVPHATWTAGVQWRTPRLPLLRLALHVYADRSTPRRKKWQRVLERRLELDQRPRRPG